MSTVDYKKCNVCQAEKPISDFYFRKETGKYRGNCKKCKPLISKADIIAKANAPTKVCKDCGIEKSSSEFGRAGKGGIWMQPYCKPCDSERKREHTRKNSEQVKNNKKKYYSDNFDKIAANAVKYYKNNKDKILDYHKEYGKKNKDIISKKGIEYRKNNNDYVKERDRQARLNSIDRRLAKEKEYRLKKTPEQKIKDAEYAKEWRVKNAEKLKQQAYARKHIKREQRRVWCNNKSATDIGFRILKNLRGRTRFALNRDKAVKSDTTEKMLGCTIPFFKNYFESLFTEDMNWYLFMKGEIWIDHKKPCSKFDLTQESEQRACFHYTNLQPLFWYDNIKKSNHYEEQKVA